MRRDVFCSAATCAERNHCVMVVLLAVDVIRCRRVAMVHYQEIPMTWTTPTLVEICIGLEINGYLPAEF
jgi:coenzyme PQQ precursor peptide PqqA